MSSAFTAELERAAGDLDDYVKKNYPAVSLTEAIRGILPDAEVKAVAGHARM